MTFIPGFSTIKGDPQDPKENERTYAESQEQRRLERKLREERRDLAVMKAQGASGEDIALQKARVDKASDDIEAFCEQTGRTRRKNREWTPVQVSFDGAKIPPYSVPVANVTNEYRAKAKPGKGTVIEEDGYDSQNKKHEKKVANDLVRQLGGDVVQIRRSKGEPDYRWRGTLWELKETSSANSVDKQTEKALNQTAKYFGNIIIDYVGKDEIDVSSIVLDRVRRSAKHEMDIIILINGILKDIYRYKKRR